MKISNLRKLSSLILISLFISCTKEAIQENNELPQSFIDSINTNGLQLMNPKEYNELPIIDATEVKSMLNNELSTRSTRIKLNTPPVWDQGSEGSCVSFACGYVGVSYYLKMIKNVPYSTSGAYRSPEFLYNNSKIIGDCNSGSYYINVLNYLVNYGTCSWSQMPYSASNGCSNRGTQTQKDQAKLGKIKKWSRVSNTVNNLRDYIYKGYPILLGMQLDKNFINQTYSYPYTYTIRGGAQIGGHAMVIVGYDDLKKAFIIQNSWGKDRHDNGFLYITYSLMPYLNAETYVIDPIK
ncbi:MAG: C1 family peptidase [Saprospiraceae bacterium]|nr:C1 family peptidase [Saprospiraceae bacterium]